MYENTYLKCKYYTYIIGLFVQFDFIILMNVVFVYLYPSLHYI